MNETKITTCNNNQKVTAVAIQLPAKTTIAPANPTRGQASISASTKSTDLKDNIDSKLYGRLEEEVMQFRKQNNCFLDISYDELFKSLIVLEPENDLAPCTTLSCGEIFHSFFEAKACFCSDTGAWMIFDGCRWKNDETAVKQMVLMLVKLMLIYVKDYLGSDSHDELFKAAKKLITSKAQKDVLLAAALSCAKSLEDFDSNSSFINCQNATIELGKDFYTVREHRATDFITECMPCEYDKNAVSPVLNKFLLQIMAPAPEKKLTRKKTEEYAKKKLDYLQRALGGPTLGKPVDECFFIFYGPQTRNGKGVLMNTVKVTMGSDYFVDANAATLAKGSYARTSAPSEDIARLRGARVINVSEPDEGVVLNSAFVKAATGRDRIVARIPYAKNSIAFEMSGTFFISANNLPVVTDVSVFKSNRVIVIPFEQSFVGKANTSLKSLLSDKTNKSAMLNWLLEGYVKQSKKSIRTDIPECVVEATEAYRETAESAKVFIREEMKPSEQACCSTSEAYSAYSSWCKAYSKQTQSQEKFKEAILEAGNTQIKRVRRNGNSNKEMLIFGLDLI